jgi:uncharacterized protein YdcH (DUF465 family)
MRRVRDSEDQRGQRPVGRWPFLFSTAKEGIMPDREVLIQRLTEGSEEFRRLRADHQGFERELSDLQARPFLTTEQQWRVSEVKKLKLMTKDRMEALIRESQRSAQTPA